MTVTSNIHVGLPAWTSQVYASGARISNVGNAYQCVVPGLSLAAPVGQGTAQIGETATQIVPNPTETGTANGVLPSPGSAPTGWDLTDPAWTDPALTFQIVNHGVDATTGFNFLDLQISGISGGTDNQFFFVPSFSGVPALPSRTYTQVVYLALVGGSMNGIAQVVIDADNLDSNGNYINGNEIFTPLTGTVQKFTNIFTTTSTTSRLNPRAAIIGLTAGASINITIRIEQPTCTLVTGPATWQFLSTVDFTTVQLWVNSWPATFTQNLIGQLWNDGPITTTAGTSYMVASGHTAGSFTATLTTAPGEGIKDRLRDNDFPLQFNTSQGVGFVLPSSAGGNINYFNISDANVILEGLQFQDPLPTSACSIVNTNPGATGFILRKCVVDGYGQSGGNSILLFGDAFTMTNYLVIDRQFGSSGGPTVAVTGTGTYHSANGVVVGLAGPSQTGWSSASTSATATLRNAAFFGYTPSFAKTAGTVTADHCVFSDGSLPSGLTDGGSNLTGKLLSTQFAGPVQLVSGFGPATPGSGFSSGFGPPPAPSDFRTIPGSDFVNAGTTDTSDIPAGDDLRGVPRPQGAAWDIGPWEFVTAAPLPGPLVGRQVEQPDTTARVSVLSSGPVGTAVQLTSVLRVLMTRQQQPDQPLPVLRSGSVVVPVIPAARPTIVVRQEAPRDSVPGPFLWGPPQFPNVATLGQVGAVRGREQEIPPRIPAVTWPGTYGPNVAPPPHVGMVMTRQEQPAQPSSFTVPSLPQTPAQSPRPPGADTVIMRQEQPGHPPPAVLHNIYGQNVRAPVSDAIVVRQQQPDHPASVLSAGAAGTFTVPVISAARPNVFVRQEQPVQPPPVVVAGVPPTNPPPPGPIVGGTALLVRQQQPDQPPPALRAGVQGPNVRPPVTDSIVVRQQQPDLLQPVVVSGPSGQLVLPPVTQAILLRQEQPGHPSAALTAGVQGPNVRPPVADRLQTVQQLPDHPSSLLRPSLQQTGTVLTKVADSVAVRQQQPDQPASVLSAGAAGTLTAPVISAARPNVFVRQQQPDQPVSILIAPLPVGRVGVPTLPIMARQQQPDQPSSVFVTGVQTTTFIPATPRSVFVRQEQPSHPSSALMAGIFETRKHVKGRTVRLAP